MAPKKVLLALDENEHSDRAFRFYLDSIYCEGDSVILVNVLDIPSYSEGSSAIKDLVTTG